VRRGGTVMVRPVVEVQLSGEQRGENVVRVVRITTRRTFQINRGARCRTPGRKTSASGARTGGDDDGAGSDALARADGLTRPGRNVTSRVAGTGGGPGVRGPRGGRWKGSEKSKRKTEPDWKNNATRERRGRTV